MYIVNIYYLAMLSKSFHFVLNVCCQIECRKNLTGTCRWASKRIRSFYHNQWMCPLLLQILLAAGNTCRRHLHTNGDLRGPPGQLNLWQQKRNRHIRRKLRSRHQCLDTHHSIHIIHFLFLLKMCKCPISRKLKHKIHINR